MNSEYTNTETMPVQDMQKTGTNPPDRDISDNNMTDRDIYYQDIITKQGESSRKMMNEIAHYRRQIDDLTKQLQQAKSDRDYAIGTSAGLIRLNRIVRDLGVTEITIRLDTYYKMHDDEDTEGTSTN